MYLQTLQILLLFLQKRIRIFAHKLCTKLLSEVKNLDSAPYILYLYILNAKKIIKLPFRLGGGGGTQLSCWYRCAA